MQPIVRFKPPPIADGETNVYEIVNQNNIPVAIRKVKTNKIMYDEVPAFKVTTVEKISENTSPVESTVVFFSRENMAPLASFHYSRPPKPLVTVAARYQERFVEITTVTKDDEFKRNLPITPPTFDIQQLPILGRWIRFGWQMPYQILIVAPQTSPPGGMSFKGKIRIGAIDTINTQAGRFECYKVVTETETSKIIFWFEKIGARRLIRSYDSTTCETVNLISSTIPLTPGKTNATVNRPSHVLSFEIK
ncbi:MAG: DUF3108 domain-containing protein [bacterium]